VLLADSSVWIEHLRRGVPELEEALEEGTIVVHPFVLGELACGMLRDREAFLEDLARLPEVVPAEHDEVLELVERRRLAGTGIGWVDAHLIAAARIADVELWTLDRALQRAWEKLAS
jgi:hypothetical protein